MKIIILIILIIVILLFVSQYWSHVGSAEIFVHNYFPPTPNWQNLQINEEGMYSVSFPQHARMISDMIWECFQHIDATRSKKSLIITDCSSCVGGDAIRFAMEFGHVNCVELNPENMSMLKNNMKVFGFANVNFYLGPYEKFNTTLQQDIVYADPPWGGRDYKSHKALRLTYGQHHVEDLLLAAKAKLKVLKLPKNYDVEYLQSKMPGIVIEHIKKKNGDTLFLVCFYTHITDAQK